MAANEKRDYRTIPAILMDIINRKNASVTDSNMQARDTLAKTAAAIAAEGGRTKAAEDRVGQASADSTKAVNDFAAARTAMEGEKTKLESANRRQ